MFRVCWKCSQECPISSFHARQKGKDYVSSVCLDCRQAQKRANALRYHHAHPEKARAKRSAYRAAHLKEERGANRRYRQRLAARNPETIPVPDRKLCKRCGIGKSASDFGRKISSPDGLRSWCFQCDRSDSLERSRAKRAEYGRNRRSRYRAHPEIYRKQCSEWHKQNRHKIRDRIRKYQARNAGRLREYRRNRHAAKKQRFNEESRAWRRNNPEKVREYCHARRARKAGSDGHYTPADITRIRKAQRGKCAICRAMLGSKFHRDHINPISKGGSNRARNIQLTCDPCNLTKHAKDPITFMQERGLLL
jgi:hypothetical protein